MSIQLFTDLYENDHAPAEAAERLSSLVTGIMPSDPALGLVKRAWWLFRIAARVEDFEAWTEIMEVAKETCRQIALIWLEYRACPCCIALRTRLETKTGKWNR